MDKEKRETELVQQYLKLRSLKLKPNDGLDILKKMGFNGTQRTLDRHVVAVRSTGHAVSPVKKDCSHRSLNDDQMSQVDAWVLGQNTKNSPIGYSDVQKFINEEFNIKICKRTAGNILLRLGHTKKTCQTKTSGFSKTNAELKEEFMEFITKMKKEKRFVRHPADIRSIDVSYTKKPPTRVTTFSPQGGCKQRAASRTKLYTNAIVTMISGDGVNHTPCMLFTHDPSMAKMQKNTKRGKRIRAEFEEDLKRYNITEDRIIYEKSAKNYFAESPDIYEQFLNHYQVPKDTLILHDGGNGFKRQKTSIFDNLGFKNHVAYPTDVHQFLSPNDNKLHGCKSTWKEEYYKFRSGVSSSLRLMNLIDLETEKNSKKYFRNNLFNVKRSNLDEIIGV